MTDTELASANQSSSSDNPPAAAAGTVDRLHPGVVSDVEWFSEKVRSSIGDRLVSLTVYGPAVTTIFNPKEHQIHFLLIMDRRDVDALLRLATHSKPAGRRRIAPPLVTTSDSFAASRDVFPLEWIDIEQFHRNVIGNCELSTTHLKPSNIRLQCERDLRSLEILLLRGILASGGQAKRIDAIERDSADTLIRVMRGIAWLAGDRLEHLPDDVAATAARITGIELTGCREAIASGGRHDLQTLKMIVDEVTRLTVYIDNWQPNTSESSQDGGATDSPADRQPAADERGADERQADDPAADGTSNTRAKS